jgi:hypothetical protein
MEAVTQLTERTRNRIFYFKDGCDQDGFEITTCAHLQLAYAAVSSAVYAEPKMDMGRAKEIIDKEVVPVFRAILVRILQKET